MKGSCSMNTRALFALLATIVLLGGCSTSMQIQTGYQPIPGEKFRYQVVSNAEVSEEALTIMRERLNTQLSGSGQLGGGSDESATRVEVIITSYRMRHGATRALVGIFAGTDNMMSTVEVKDSRTNTVKAKFDVSSSNATAWGTSRGLIEDHADQIVQYLKTGSKQ